MHAIAQEVRPFRRNLHALNAKTVERKNNHLHYRAQLANLCELLAREDLTATSYRVALDTIARMLRRGSATEAVPVAWVAARLGVHRNAISLAYGSLETLGVLHRVPVKRRGAPTRTRLVGLAAGLVDGAITPFVNVASGPTEPLGPDSPANDEPPMSAPIAVVASEPTPEPVTPPATAVAIQQESRAAFAFSASVNASMIAKVPYDDRLRAMQTRNGAMPAIEASWGLTDGEAAHFRALVPKAEAAPIKRKEARASKVMPSHALAGALLQVLPKLVLLTGCEAQAHVVADQIAYQAQCGGLGRGNVLAGVRAGVKLVERQVWTEPRDWVSHSPQWGGISLRARIGALGGERDDAQQTVH